MRFLNNAKEKQLSTKWVWICFCPIAGIAIIAIIYTWLSPTLYKAQATAQQIACADNLRRIGNVLELYTSEHQGKMPTGVTSGGIFRMLKEEYYYHFAAQMLICPGNSIDDIDLDDSKGVSYYIDPSIPDEIHPKRAIVADRPPWDHNHKDGVNVLFADGYVRFIRPGDSGPPDKISNPYIEEDTDIYANTGDPYKHAWIRWEREPE